MDQIMVDEICIKTEILEDMDGECISYDETLIKEEPDVKVKTESIKLCERKIRQPNNKKKKRIQGGTEILRCPYCNLETTWKSYLKHHIKRFHTESNHFKQYSCPHCTFKSKWRFSLLNHLKVHSEPEEIQMYKCPKCSYQSKWRGSISGHMKVHLQPKLAKKVYKCDKCNFETMNKDNLNEHTKEHIPPQELFKCDLCSFTSKYRHGVHLHLRVHNRK